MHYTSITPPAMEPVSLTELKQYLRITHDAEDVLLGFLIRAAREWVEQTTRHFLLEQRISVHISFDLRNPKIRLMDGRTGILMPIGPVQHIHHIHNVLVDDQKVLLARSAYKLSKNGQASVIITQSADGIAMDIDCTVGYGTSVEDVPTFLRHMVLQWALHLYEHRGLSATRLPNITELPLAYHPWRLP